MSIVLFRLVHNRKMKPILYIKNVHKDVNKGNKIIIAVIGILAIAFIGSYVAISSMSGTDSPLSVIMSSSMQHDPEHSQLGTIDTGDVVIVFSPDNAEIQSYVQGTITGFSTFGDYGSVIIYDRGSDKNPVIHRAIVYLNYDSSTQTWNSPELKDYDPTKWNVTNGTWESMTGTLKFINITQSHKTVSINLDTLGKNSGYLTMGDNPKTNTYFDQSGIVNHPINEQSIVGVPQMEIPWFGVIKVWLNPSKQQYLEYVPNSIVCLVMLFSTIFLLIFFSDIIPIKRETKEILKKYEH